MASNNRIDNIGGVWYFPLYDNNGNITDYVSETGEVVASYEYDAFGRTLSESGPMVSAFPFRFSTKYYDAEAKLYYYGERFYSSELGRWLNRDPIEEAGGDNLYMFCGNNSLARCDFTGCADKGTVQELKSRYSACYILTIKVDAKGLNYNDAQSFATGLMKNNLQGEKGVGHTWVRLEDVRKKIVIEGGHSGETRNAGKNPKITNPKYLTYTDGFYDLASLSPSAPSPMPSIPEADPKNPIRWLRYIYKDGYWQEGDGGHEATSELSVSLTNFRFKSAMRKINFLRSKNAVQLRSYGLTKKQCTSTAHDIAVMAGVLLDPYVTLSVPSSLSVGLNSYRTWTDSAFQTLRFASPDKMQDELRNWNGVQHHVFH